MTNPLARQLIDEFDANGPSPRFHALNAEFCELSFCPGYGSPENGIPLCGKEKDYDKPWCDDCQDSVDLDLNI